MKRRFKALIVDHDDTTVDSSRSIHWPAHCVTMRELRPGIVPVSFDGWMIKNHTIGIRKFLREEIGFQGRDKNRELEIWRSFTTTTTPSFYDGILDVYRRFTELGGIFAVCSHSEEEQIRRHYSEKGDGFMPSVIYGWNDDKMKIKPNPFPVEDLMRRFDLDRSDCCVLDDLSPGIEMAKAARVVSVGAGWAHDIESIRVSMKSSCDFFFPTVSQFRDWLFLQQ